MYMINFQQRATNHYLSNTKELQINVIVYIIRKKHVLK